MRANEHAIPLSAKLQFHLKKKTLQKITSLNMMYQSILISKQRFIDTITSLSPVMSRVRTPIHYRGRSLTDITGVISTAHALCHMTIAFQFDLWRHAHLICFRLEMDTDTCISVWGSEVRGAVSFPLFPRYLPNKNEICRRAHR